MNINGNKRRSLEINCMYSFMITFIPLLFDSSQIWLACIITCVCFHSSRDFIFFSSLLILDSKSPHCLDIALMWLSWPLTAMIIFFSRSVESRVEWIFNYLSVNFVCHCDYFFEFQLPILPKKVQTVCFSVNWH